MSLPQFFSTRASLRPGQTQPEWIHFAIVSHECVVWVELVPAAWSGWNLRASWTQGAEEWPGMSAMQIIAFKQHDSRYPFVPATEGEIAMLSRMFSQLAA